jgi:ABC-type glycerol-3-phosphate transport system permease component
LALPGVGAATVLAFRGAWGTFFLPLILLSSAQNFVLPLGLLRAYLNYTAVDYGMMNAMALIYMAPTLLLFLFAREYLIKGTMAGAMAGQ